MPNLRQQTYFFFFQSSSASQSEAFLFLGLIQQNKFTNSSQNGLLICASSLQVLTVILQVEFTSAVTSVHINVLCLTVILTVIKFF